LEKIRVLIIDDEKSICETLSYMFEKKGYIAETSNTGSEAINKLKNQPFDVALIDIKLPDYDGINLLKHFKKNYPDLVCIIITGYASVQNSILALKEGADDYFLKPANMDEVFLRVGEALEKQRLKRKLRESEEKYRLITENANDLIAIINKKNKIEYINENPCNKLLGYSKNEILSKNRFELVHPDDQKRITNLLGIVSKKSEGSEEIRIKHKKGHFIWLDIRGNKYTDRYGEEKIILISRDITIRKNYEEELKKRLIKFKLEDGKTYIVQESAPALSIEAFIELLKLGRHGLIISRTPQDEFEEQIEFSYDFFWLAEKVKRIDINIFKTIEEIVENMSKRSVILIERLDYLISKIGFKETLTFIQDLREITYLKKQILIISIDPRTLAQEKMRLLEKEGREIELSFMVKLPEDLLEILRYIYKENNLGLKPSYSEIGKELKMSRPTVRKKMKILIANGYLIENTKGRKKIIELLEKGRRLFLS